MQKLFALAVALTLAVACGRSDAEKRAEEVAKAVKAAEGTSQAAAQAATTAAKALGGLAATTPDGKPVEIASAETLATSLPQMSGWEMAQPRNQKLATPFPIAQSETTYRKGDSRIDVKVVDAASAQMLLLPWSMMMASGYSKETGTGHEKAVTVGGHPGFERWNNTSKRGELNLLINQRFMVTIEGHRLTDTTLLHEFAAKVNTGALR